MSTGQVKWFNNAKGFGFILPDDGGDDLFAHYSAIGMEGYKTLKAGQQVTFETIEGPKGLHAANIKPLEESAGESASPEPASAEQQHAVEQPDEAVSEDPIDEEIPEVETVDVEPIVEEAEADIQQS